MAFEFDRVQQDRRAFTHLPWASYIAKSGSRYPCAQALKLPGEERIRSNEVDRFDLVCSHPRLNRALRRECLTGLYYFGEPL